MITLRRADNEIAMEDDESYKPGPYWSLMLEISEGPLKEISNSTLVEQVINRKAIYAIINTPYERQGIILPSFLAIFA